MTIYSPERQWPRLVPTNAVMVSIFSGVDQAFGLLANVSEVGVSIVSGVHFEPGSSILVRIEFEAQGKPFSSQAKVVWCRDETPPNQPASFIHGAAFVHMTEEQLVELKMVLNHPEFQKPVVPGKSKADSGELEEMMVDLNDDLEGLSTKISGEKDRL